MKRFILFLVFMLSMVNLLEAQSVGQVAKGLKPDGTFAPILLDAQGRLITNTESSGGSTGTMTIILPSINLATKTYAILATNTVTLLRTIASYSTGDLIILQGRSRWYYDLSSSPNSTAAQLQTTGYMAEAGDIPIRLQLTTGCSLELVADPSSIATLTITVAKSVNE